MKNSEKFRNMTDEEQIEFFNEFMGREEYPFCRGISLWDCDGECKKCITKWLNQEAKE